MTKHSQTYTGLKAFLLLGSIGASLAGGLLLARNGGVPIADTGQEVPIVETPFATPVASGGFKPEELQPIPTVVQPYVYEEPDPPAEQAASAPQASSAPAGSGDNGAAPAPGDGESIIPTVVAVGALPPMPAPPSGGGGGGGGGGKGGGGGASSKSS